MKKEKSNRLFILAISAGLLLLGTTVFLQGQSIIRIEKSLKSMSQKIQALESGASSNIEQDICVLSGGQYKNNTCLCEKGYYLEGGQCIDEFGLPGGITGQEMTQEMNQKFTQ